MGGVPENIIEHLKTLNLPVSKLPSVGEVRQAYKALLRTHPDKAGAAATQLFQSITEAVRLILEYLTLNPAPDESNKCEKDEDAALLKLLEQTGDLKFNKECVVFKIQPAEGAAWMRVLSAKLGKSTAMEDGVGVRMKLSDWSIPHVSDKTKKTYGSISACVWLNPKSGESKIMLQGSSYLAFVLCILPGMIKKVREMTFPELQNLVQEDTARQDVSDENGSNVLEHKGQSVMPQ